MKTSNIKYFIELNQLGLLDDEGSLWAHTDPGTSTTTARQVLYKGYLIFLYFSKHIPVLNLMRIQTKKLCLHYFFSELL